MTKEERDLLNIDLWYRIPYKVFVDICLPSWDGTYTTVLQDVRLIGIQPVSVGGSGMIAHYIVQGDRKFDLNEYVARPYLKRIKEVSTAEQIAYRNDDGNYTLQDFYNMWHVDYHGLLDRNFAVHIKGHKGYL